MTEQQQDLGDELFELAHGYARAAFAIDNSDMIDPLSVGEEAALEAGITAGIHGILRALPDLGHRVTLRDQ